MTIQPMTPTIAATVSRTPTVNLSLSLDAAEAVMALIKHDANARIADGLPVPATAAEVIPALQAAITAGWDRIIDEEIGCLDLNPSVVTPTEPVLLGSADGIVGALLPGAVEAWEAVNEAIKFLCANGVTIDTTDTSLSADISRPRWMVFHACGNAAHEVHPQIAAEGRDTAGAVLFTRVQFTRL